MAACGCGGGCSKGWCTYLCGWVQVCFSMLSSHYSVSQFANRPALRESAAIGCTSQMWVCKVHHEMQQKSKEVCLVKHAKYMIRERGLKHKLKSMCTLRSHWNKFPRPKSMQSIWSEKEDWSTNSKACVRCDLNGIKLHDPELGDFYRGHTKASTLSDKDRKARKPQNQDEIANKHCMC